jgi:hypothetical protein
LDVVDSSCLAHAFPALYKARPRTRLTVNVTQTHVGLARLLADQRRLRHLQLFTGGVRFSTRDDVETDHVETLLNDLGDAPNLRDFEACTRLDVRYATHSRQFSALLQRMPRLRKLECGDAHVDTDFTFVPRLVFLCVQNRWNSLTVATQLRCLSRLRHLRLPKTVVWIADLLAGVPQLETLVALRLAASNVFILGPPTMTRLTRLRATILHTTLAAILARLPALVSLHLSIVSPRHRLGFGMHARLTLHLRADRTVTCDYQEAHHPPDRPQALAYLVSAQPVTVAALATMTRSPRVYTPLPHVPCLLRDAIQQAFRTLSVSDAVSSTTAHDSTPATTFGS